MNCAEVDDRLHAYINGDLPNAERQVVEGHLERCLDCRAEADLLRSLIADVEALPTRVQPAHDLWPAVEARIERDSMTRPWWKTVLQRASKNGVYRDQRDFAVRLLHPRRRSAWAVRGVLAAAVILLMMAGVWVLTRSSRGAWEVARRTGTPRIGADRMEALDRLQVGEWVETDDSSRVTIKVGTIGQVDLDPNTRVRLVETRLTEHRLALDRGTLHARIWAPPRLFFVETPSAVAIDLGCAYTLAVDDTGRGLLHVTAGQVELERDGRTSVVPAGALCETRPGIGPGTPFSEQASGTLRRALALFDFEKGGNGALTTVLAEAREHDALTLWSLFSRVDRTARGRVYDRMAMLIPPPEGVTRDGVLRLDRRMLDRWNEHLGL